MLYVLDLLAFLARKFTILIRKKFAKMNESEVQDGERFVESQRKKVEKLRTLISFSNFIITLFLGSLFFLVVSVISFNYLQQVVFYF